MDYFVTEANNLEVVRVEKRDTISGRGSVTNGLIYKKFRLMQILPH